MPFPDESTDPSRQFAAYLSRLEARIAKLEAANIVPVLDADPADDDPTNMWMLNDGRLRARTADGVVVEFRPVSQQAYVPTLSADPTIASGIKLWFLTTGALRGRLANDVVVAVTGTQGQSSGNTTAPPPTTTVPKPAPVVVKQYQKIYTADDTACYCPAHGVESALYYGAFSGSAHPERRLMFGFPDATIRADLSGATIRSVSLRVKNLHSWPNSGVDIYWGAHNVATLGATFSQGFKPFWHSHWPKVGGDTWRAMGSAGLWIGNAFRDNRIKGLTVDQPSTSNSFYGQLHPGLDLAITYTK
jgi:hypothetical protein